jgi:CRISPR-associated protein Csa3
MRTYVSPIGYDTRRITRPLISRGVDNDDRLILLRPGEDTDTEQADQAISDIEQFLQEIAPDCELVVERIVTDSFHGTIRDCCRVLSETDQDREIIVSLGGGARDLLLPLTVAALVYTPLIDTTLFFSDLDNTVSEWELPTLTTSIPDRAFETLDAVVNADGWLTLSAIADATDQSKSTVIRHVSDLEDAGVVEADTSEKAKRVRVTFSGELLLTANSLTGS